MTRPLTYADLFSPAYFRAYNLLQEGKGREFWFKGGRGSGKTSFVSTYCALDLVADGIRYLRGELPRWAVPHMVIFRKFGSDLRDSVFAHMQSSIEILGLSQFFSINLSNLNIVHRQTGQMIQFSGLDEPAKIKGLKPPFGYFKYLWFEELTQFHGMAEIRSVKQSALRARQGLKPRTFATYNPPMSQASWVNVEANVPTDGRYVFTSDYRSMPKEWLGDEFIEEARILEKTNPRLYAHEYLGEVTGTGGTVFPNVHIREITDEEISHFDNLRFGQDWGYTNAFAWVAVNYQPKKKRILIFDEIYQSHLTPSRAAQLIKKKDLHGEPIYADCEDAAAIAQFNNEFGITTYPVKKGPDSRRYGYRWLQGLFEIVIDPKRCPNCAREFQLMEYKQDRKTGQFLEDYPKEADHSIDAVRYALEIDANRRGLF